VYLQAILFGSTLFSAKMHLFGIFPLALA